MAIRFRRDRAKWQVYWKNPYTGKQESAFYASEKEAQKADSLKKHQLKFEKELFKPQVELEESRKAVDYSLNAVIYSFLRSKRYQRNTLTALIYLYRNVLAFFGKDKSIRDIQKIDLSQYKQHLNTTGIAVSTVNKRLKQVFCLLRWAKEEGYIETLPDFPKLDQATVMRYTPPTTEQLIKLIQVAPPHAQRVLILGSKLGCRVGPCELYKMRWSDVDLQKGVVRLQAAHKNKHEPIREIPIKKSLLRIIQAWKEEDETKGIEYVIHYRGKPVKNIHGSWKKIHRLAGLPNYFRPYDLRHAFATDALASGADVGTVAKLMGHTSPMMVLKTYQHVLTPQKQAVIEALPDVPEYAQNGMPKKINTFIQ